MADETTQQQGASIEALFRLHCRLLEDASAELLGAVAPISETLAQILEEDELPPRSALERAVTDLQAADSVAQRLAHVQEALSHFGQLASVDLLSVTPEALEQACTQLWQSFTIAGERAAFSELLSTGAEHRPDAGPTTSAGDLELF